MILQQHIAGVVGYFEYFLHAHLLLSFVAYVLIILTQRKHFKRLKIQTFTKESISFEKINAPKVSVVIPVRNESWGVLESIEAALSANYPDLQVVLVNDGSTDDTLDIVVDRYCLVAVALSKKCYLTQNQPARCFLSLNDGRIIVLDKAHSGKADSLNLGIEYAAGDYVCCMDGDSIILPDAISKLVTKFINEPNLVALGGAVAPSNSLCIRNGAVVRKEAKTSLLEKIQVVEYLRSFTLWRTGWSYVDGLVVISGAMTMFKKQALQNVGGFNSDTVTEDLDIILRLHQYYCDAGLPYHIWTIPNVICWTRVPKNLAQIKRQRIRWMVGALQCVTQYRSLVCNTKNQTLGWLALPHLIAIEIFAPVIELFGLIVLLASAFIGILSIESAIVYAFLIYALTGFYSWNSIYAGDIYFKNYSSLMDDLRIGIVGLLEPIGYRQLDSLWRIIGWWQWLTRKKTEW